MEYTVAQVNVGRLAAPLGSPEVADFVAGLDRVNAAADSAPGFVWRMQTEDGNATAVRGFEWATGDPETVSSDGGIIINMSAWETVEALAAYVYGPTHVAVLRRRREWFKRIRLAYAAVWWIPRGHIPTVAEAEDRVKHLRVHGPTPYAFTLKVHFPPPGSGDLHPLHSPEDWACPV